MGGQTGLEGEGLEGEGGRRSSPGSVCPLLAPLRCRPLTRPGSSSPRPWLTHPTERVKVRTDKPSPQTDLEEDARRGWREKGLVRKGGASAAGVEDGGDLRPLGLRWVACTGVAGSPGPAGGALWTPPGGMVGGRPQRQGTVSREEASVAWNFYP